MQVTRRLGVPKWIEDVSDVVDAHGRLPGRAVNATTRRLVLVPEVALSGDRIEMRHTQPILRRNGTLVLPCQDGSLCRIELRLLWTRFSSEQIYHTVGIIKWAWSLRLAQAPQSTPPGDFCQEMRRQAIQ